LWSTFPSQDSGREASAAQRARVFITNLAEWKVKQPPWGLNLQTGQVKQQKNPYFDGFSNGAQRNACG
jgi:hypothetical protein